MADAAKIVIVGDGPVADALRPMLGALGWEASVTDAVPRVDADVDAVVVLSHDEDVDAPAIAVALAAGTSYVGAMGSRSTRARRREWLLAHGVTDDDLAALHTPIGLDIGADGPGEIAVAILAEIVALRHGAGPGG